MLVRFMAVVAHALACCGGLQSADIAVLAGFDTMRAELSAVYAPAGLSPEWHPLESPALVGQPAAVVAVRFTGACRWDWRKPSAAVTGVLARTAQVDGELLPLITVDCARVAAFVQAPSPGLLGRALARVLAHELYHYLTQQTAHTHTVLFSESVGSSDLLVPAVGFDATELEALRAAVTRSAAAPVKLKAS